jgi:hypothetical protein
LDIGEVWEEKAFQQDLPVRNRTGESVQILAFVTSCGCVSIKPNSLVVPAGETRTVRVTLDLTIRPPWALGLAQRPFETEIYPQVKSTRSAQRVWKLRGTVKCRVALDAPTVDFGEEAVHGLPPAWRKVRATAHVPVERLEAKVDAKLMTAQVKRLGEGAKNQFEIKVAPQPSLPPGPFDSEVEIRAITPDGASVSGATLKVMGRMQPLVRPLPARILMGSRKVGETAEAVLVLQAPEDLALKVEQIAAESPDIHVTALNLPGHPPGRTFRITPRVAKQGDQASAVRFRVSVPGQPPSVLTTEVAYRGE